MNHDRSPTDRPESSARDSVGPTRITDLPEPLLTEVTKRLTTENPVETLENITNFKLMSRAARQASRTESLETFHGRLKQLSTFVRTLRNAALQARTLPGGRYLNEYHEERMLNEVAYHPALGEAYTTQAGAVDRNLGSPSGSGTVLQSPTLDVKIGSVKESVMDLAVTVMEREIFVDDLISSIRPIARSIKEAHDSARAELMSAERQRGDRGR
ncbi:virulence protein [Agrobacterium vitis]|uniref:virulence protein n=1 Tax=Allorhizobium ampelinum TaxID=3025782 RepID=UPI001F2C3DF9|nr:virulence protein [Allorhizobium ampelinum]MCF1450536.1 virulence protein [Allorhizobium ampelinum]